MMQNFVKREPERFARLSLRFPTDINSCYWMNVLYGLRVNSRDAKPAKQLAEIVKFTVDSLQ